MNTHTVEKTVLPTGIRVVTEYVPTVRSVAVGIWADVGSRDEGAEEAGICHFIEHMVFKGTRRRRMHQIAARLESVGGYLNAFTGKEHTSYYARCMDEHLDRALEVLIDLVFGPTMPEKEIEKEKDVVVEEMKMYEDDPDDLIFDYLEEELYRGHPMARPVIGQAETVRSFTREGLLQFMDRCYTPDRIVIAVSGNARHDQVVKSVQKWLKDADRQKGSLARTGVNGYTAGQRLVKKPIEQAHLVLGTRALHLHHPKRVVLTVLNSLLGGGMSSLLNQHIRERYGFCYSIYSFVNLYSDTGDFGVYMGTDARRIERSKRLILREFDTLVQAPVKARTLEIARNQCKGAVLLSAESMNNRMQHIAKQELYYGRQESLDDMLQQIEAVTPEDVLELAREMLVPDAFSTIELIPSEA